MVTYTLFFSWQSDLKNVRSKMGKALEDVRKGLASEDIDLRIEQDNRNNDTEYGDITEHIRNRIMSCDIFVADVTPVQRLGADGALKLIPNPNVMFELGFASCRLHDSRIFRVADFGRIDNMCYMPFDINHTSVMRLESFCDVKALAIRLKTIFKAIEEGRKRTVPDYGCEISFSDGSAVCDIYPEYKAIEFVPQQPKAAPPSTYPSYMDVVLGRNSAVNVIRDNATSVQKALARFKQIKGTVNKSLCPVSFILKNTGGQTLDDCVIFIECRTQGTTFARSNVKMNFELPNIWRHVLSISDDGTSMNAEVRTLNATLQYELGQVFIKVPREEETVTLYWKVVGRQHQAEGLLEVRPHNQINRTYQTNATRAGETVYEDAIEDIPE